MRKNILFLIITLAAFILGYRLFSAGPEVKVGELSGSAIICFGDSLTYGTGAPDGKSYPDRLSGMVGRPVINAGVPGDTTAEGLARLREDVLDRDPRLVLITLGGNDLKNGVDKDTARANLKTIIEQIQQAGALPVVGGLSFIILDRGYGGMYEELAEETGVLLVPDILDGIMGRDNLMSDPIHPNAEGYEIMAERFYEAVEPYL